MLPLDVGNDTRAAYRIGWWTHRWWPKRTTLVGVVTGRHEIWPGQVHSVARRECVERMWRDVRLLRFPHRPWQAEEDVVPLLFARRAFTAGGARRRIAADAGVWMLTGRHSRAQRWQTWKKNARCRSGWHRMYRSIGDPPRRFCLSCGRDDPAGCVPSDAPAPSR